jgi:alpha-tubulin suppressor-like RCC1 family protein
MKKLLLISFIALLFSISVNGQTGTGCWRMVSAGQNFSMGIKMDGTLWGWGMNGNLLGLNGNMANQNLPIQIGTANDWATVSAGTVHTLAVKTNGTLWSWGNGQFGQLGNGTFNSATWTVTQVGTATDWQTVSAGNRFSLVIKTNGTLWSFGLNNFGQLGINSIIDQSVAVQVGTASNWLKIDAGNQHSLAIDNAGLMYAWGNNAFGQLGDGTINTSLFPILIGSANNWSEVSAGFDHSLAIDTSGFLYSWGNNVNGQLGDGTNTPTNLPIPISFSTDGTPSLCLAISAGETFSLIIKNDNTLRSSGFNNSGQLGLGNNTNTNVFNQVGTSNTWQLISAGNLHSLAMETTTSTWSTGRNIEGQLGIGNNTPSNTLQNVLCPTTLAINNISKDKIILVAYPNPTNDIVNIDYTMEKSEKITITVTNIQGQVITILKSERNSGLQSDRLDFSNQSSGIYFITLTTDNSSIMTKLIKN